MDIYDGRMRNIIVGIALLVFTVTLAVIFIFISNEEAPVSAEVLSGDARVRIINHYNICGHNITYDDILSEQYTGKTHEEISEKLSQDEPDSFVVSFDAEILTIQHDRNAACPDHYYLQDTGNSLSVYKNETGEEMNEIINLQINPHDFSSEARSEMQNGLLFDNLDELEMWLENMVS